MGLSRGSLLEQRLRRATLLVLLYALPVCIGVSSSAVTDPDIWWHLRTGQWIVQHHAIPTTDPFSTYAMGRPWFPYSWLFEFGIYGLYRGLGLFGILIYESVMLTAIAVALHALIRRFESDFTTGVALAIGGIMAMAPLYSPRPWLLTILFFIVELDIVQAVRSGRNSRGLLVLPLLFAFWANVHIQFVYGLFVLGLAAAEPWLSRLFRSSRSHADGQTGSAGRLWLLTGACLVATWINPFHLKVYGLVFQYAGQTRSFLLIGELLPLAFLPFASVLVLLVVLAGTFALGWQQERRPFPILLLLSAAVISFRSARDLWFAVVVAMAIIASRSAKSPATDFRARTQLPFAAVGLALALLWLSHARDLSNRQLEKTVAERFPARAVEAIAERGYSGPLYNYFDWGGYLIWQLPNLPVAMDPRNFLYGDARVERSYWTWNGRHDWASDPELSAARLVIAHVDAPLASLLLCDSRFQLVYEDRVARVFVARSSAP